MSEKSRPGTLGGPFSRVLRVEQVLGTGWS